MRARPHITRINRSLVTLCLAALTTMPAAAQTTEASPVSAQSQDYCISVMSAFPNGDTVARYQFFKLTEKMAVGATPEFKTALAHYGDGDVAPETPVIKIIEAIANPVMRQAAPELTIAYMGHLVEFAGRCETYIQGQVNSLLAYDPALANDDGVISEDALYLRQILSDSLLRLDADKNEKHSFAVNNYATSLVVMRDDIEFAAYAKDIDDIEALYMTDLDGRLARSNDIINSEIDREVLGDAVTLSDDMNKQAKQKADRDAIGTLLRILNRY